MPRALWAKAPYALLRHRSVLLAVACTSFLVALAAASAPLLRAGAESDALKGKLDLLRGRTDDRKEVHATASSRARRRVASGRGASAWT